MEKRMVHITWRNSKNELKKSMKNSFNFRLNKLLFVMVLLMFGCSEPMEKQSEKPSENVVGEVNIIPQPASIRRLGGQFELKADTKIVVTDETGIKMSAILKEFLTQNYNLTLEETNQASLTNTISFFNETTGEDEGYRLTVEPEGIQIKGTEKGMFYGIQSLIQMLPLNSTGEIKIPAREISDAPRFRYRGMHLDVARHFMSVEFVKKYLNLMSRYKFNYFHWHLTDDQGWRIEIKKYPELTEIGSKRPQTVKEKNYKPFVGDGIPIEGYYTQAEIRDIVEYAKARQITIIPEIDMPGHSSAALASYPQYGCKDNYKVQTTWGGFPDIYCPKEETFQFIEEVLSEVIDLFPNSPYLHIGGDEVMTDHWKESSFVQTLKSQKNLKTEEDVQRWFIRRIEQFAISKEKKIIVWDDVQGEGLSSTTTVMAWNSVEAGKKAAQAQHEVIMTPWEMTYFDHPQDDPKLEPLSLGNPVTLENVYNFDPIPANASPEEARLIIGGQGCIWTEFLKKPENVEYMAFPRMLALAEALWSPQREKKMGDFLSRLYQEFPRLEQAKVNYRIPRPQGLGPTIQPIAANGEKIIALTSIQNAKIYYTLDGTNPTNKSNLYQKPFTLKVEPNQTKELKAKIFIGMRESIVFSAKYTREMRLSSPGP
jgi:hexosaminidase